MQVANYGAVFTKQWVVELILDLAGYTEDRDLADMVAIEPSCGDGSFLVPMVERLSKSCEKHGRQILEAYNAIQAFDLQERHVYEARRSIESTLLSTGWKKEHVSKLTANWLKQADYLLEEHQNSKADFVIGNPPYIRSEMISNDIRAAYIKKCRTMTEGTDIYVGFIETGLKSLKPEGVLAYICADRWMRNAYGKHLRKLISTYYAVDAVLEMHGVDAFAEEVAAYPAITVLRRGTQGSVAVVTATADFGSQSAQHLIDWIKEDTFQSLKSSTARGTRLHKWFQGDSFWPSGSPERLAVLDELEKRFEPLENGFTGTKVGIGIATGADKVFITNDKTVVESNRLVKLATTAHIKSGALKWNDIWLVNPWNGNGSLVELDKYPKLKSYFELEDEKLRKRHIANKSPDRWYRTIDKVDPGLISKPKLLFQDMKSSIQPVLDPGGHYPHHNLYWVTSDIWDLEVLGGLLLSRVAQMFVECYAVRMRGGTLRFQSQYLRRICVPNPEDLGDNLKSRLIKAFKDRDVELATTAALEAYRLTKVPE